MYNRREITIRCRASRVAINCRLDGWISPNSLQIISTILTICHIYGRQNLLQQLDKLLLLTYAALYITYLLLFTSFDVIFAALSSGSLAFYQVAAIMTSFRENLTPITHVAISNTSTMTTSADTRQTSCTIGFSKWLATEARKILKLLTKNRPAFTQLFRIYFFNGGNVFRTSLDIIQ